MGGRKVSISDSNLSQSQGQNIEGILNLYKDNLEIWTELFMELQFTKMDSSQLTPESFDDWNRDVWILTPTSLNPDAPTHDTS